MSDECCRECGSDDLTCKECAESVLRELVEAVEDACEEELEQLGTLFEKYAAARRAFGRPITPVEGGPQGLHFHLMHEQPEDCAYCERAALQRERLLRAGKPDP